MRVREWSGFWGEEGVMRTREMEDFWGALMAQPRLEPGV